MFKIYYKYMFICSIYYSEILNMQYIIFIIIICKKSKYVCYASDKC